jgi:thioesterase domain-containing protein
MYESAERLSTRSEILAIENPSFATLTQACQERSLIPAGLSDDEVRKLLDRYRSNFLAARSYVAHPIPILLHLFDAKETEDAGNASALHNWELVLPSEQIRTISVPGNHLSMMESPHIESLGEALSRSLRQTREIKASQR